MMFGGSNQASSDLQSTAVLYRSENGLLVMVTVKIESGRSSDDKSGIGLSSRPGA